MTRIAVSSPKFSHVRVEEMAPRIALDFDVWEIVAEHLHHIKRIKGYLKEFTATHDLGLQIHAPLSDINISAFSEKVRSASVAEITDAIEAGAEIGVRCVTFHPGLLSPTSSLDPDRVHALAQESVKKIDRAGREHGMALACENMPRMKWGAFSRPEEILECIRGTEVGICYDAGHAHTSSTTDEFLKLAPKFVNVHVHDNSGAGDEHLVIGTGTVPFQRILSGLKTYRGNLVIECRDYDEGPRSRDALSRML